MMWLQTNSNFFTLCKTKDNIFWGGGYGIGVVDMLFGQIYKFLGEVPLRPFKLTSVGADLADTYTHTYL